MLCEMMPVKRQSAADPHKDRRPVAAELSVCIDLVYYYFFLYDLSFVVVGCGLLLEYSTRGRTDSVPCREQEPQYAVLTATAP